MLNIETAIVAHPKRSAMVRRLAAEVGANAISWDTAEVGAAGNHQQAWDYLMDLPTEWSLILEDDAKPCVGFSYQLSQVLEIAPGDIISLYLGRGRPDQWQLPISSVISQDVCFLRCSKLIHGVGYAVRTPLLRPLQKAAKSSSLGESGSRIELVDVISHWAKNNNKTICYTRPSLVDHLDGPPVIPDEEREDGQSRAVPPDPSGTNIRKAWVLGPRLKPWDSSCILIPSPDLRRKDKVARCLTTVV